MPPKQILTLKTLIFLSNSNINPKNGIAYKKTCKRDIKVQGRTNEVDKLAVTIMRLNSLRKELVVGYIPQNISKFFSMFLMIPFTSIEVEVVGKTLNRGGGCGLEISFKYRFYGQEKTVQWLTKKSKPVKKELE